MNTEKTDISYEDNEKDNDSQKHFLKGSYIGPYQIIEQIGEGGMAKVYKAYYQKLERFVAIKIMDKQIISKEEYKRFILEAKHTAQLQHPNIVTIHDAGAHMGMNYIVMDFIEGVPLNHYIQKHKLATEQICKIVKQIAQALHYAHNQGIIHRDIKPSNIIIAKQIRPIVMDFGLAKNTKVTQEVTKTGIIIGTPKYMAPEQIKGENKNISRSTDVYGLGTVFYEMLTGRSVITGETPLSISYNILHKEVIPPRTHRSDIPHDVQSICLKALEKNKQKRYRSANAMAEDIERFLNGEAVFAKQESKLYLLKKGTFRYRSYLLITTVLLLASITITQNILWSQKQSNFELSISEEQKKQKDLVITLHQKEKILEAIKYFTLNDINKSLQILTEILAENDQNVQAYYYYAYILHRIQNYKEAITNINKAIEISPNFLIAYALRGRILIYTNSHEQGIADLKKYLEVFTDKETIMILGNAYIQTERYTFALEEFQKILSEDKQNIEALNASARCLLFQKQYQQALAFARNSIRIRPNHPEAFYILGYTYYGINDWGNSILAFTNAQNFDPNHQYNTFWFPFYYFRGSAYSKVGEMEKAIRDLTAGIEIFEKWNQRNAEMYVQCLLERALVYRSQNQHKNAVADYLTLQSLYPQRVQQHLDYINKYK